ncbi:plant virulence effector HPE1-like domain-containing protein [Rhizobium sp. 9140]|uniref:plant virulence effector HPE1-like domain-containing protein n=1 Tax=Rhizobium sp. 9140 TaxID=1761900 RepID=UPI0007985F19|nr:plant virulence effector HPE1-like domain-containing protein [Rhizobium sp. 9140]CZT34396.1 hypothetical protein GA0004734_00014150 [Rhizobium sp. 9140]
MRGFLLAGLAFASAIPALTPSSALASSIEYVRTPPVSAPSVTVLHCKDCPALKPDVRAVTYVVPDLAPGTDRTEVKDINGEMKLVRAEAWLGGSPVTFISKASDEQIRIARGEPAIPPLTILATAEGDAGGGAAAATSMNVAVDATATTASLSPATAVSIASASVASSPLADHAAATAESTSHDFDGQSLQLRLN